jgi:hypothetical protein
MTNKAIALEKHGPAGAATCQVLGETPNNFRVKLLAKDGVKLPGKRYAGYGQIVSVPRRAVYDISSQLTRGL